MSNRASRPLAYPFWHISALCWPVAILAYAAATGLFTGTIRLGSEADSQLIADSPVLAGAIVLAVVALPMTVAARQAGARKHSSARTAFVAGVILVAVMALQTVVTGQFSVVQTLLVLTGIAVAVLGYREMFRPREAGDVRYAPLRTVENNLGTDTKDEVL